MKKYIEIVIGLLLWTIGLYALMFTSWREAVLILIQSGIIVVLAVIGLGLLLLGISEFRS